LGFWFLGLGPKPQTPNPQSPIPNPQSPNFEKIFLLLKNKKGFKLKKIKKVKNE